MTDNTYKPSTKRTAKTIRRAIAQDAAAAVKVRDRVHRTAMWCIEHYAAHGDTTMMSEQVNSLRQSGVYRQALLDWYKKWAKVKAKPGNDGLLLTKVDKKVDPSKTDLAGANAEPFYLKDTDSNANMPSFDAYKAIQQMLAKQKKATDHPEDFKEVRTLAPAHMKVLEGIIATVH